MPAGGAFSTFPDGALTVTPSDTSDLAVVVDRLYVGGAGNVKVTTGNGATVTFSGVTAGSYVDCRIKRVFATGTTATLMIGLHGAT